MDTNAKKRYEQAESTVNTKVESQELVAHEDHPTEVMFSPEVTSVCNRPYLQKIEARAEPIYDDSHFQHDIAVHHSSETIFCVPPKAGHVFWINVLPNTIKEFDVVPIDEYPEKERRVIYDTYKKVAIVREPFQRLWSGFNDRFVRPCKVMKVLGKAIHNLLRSGTTPKMVSNITFEEFARYLIYNNRNGIEQRITWKSYNTLCRPCQVKYDFIFMMENFKENFEIVKKIANLPPDAKVLATPLNRTLIELRDPYGETEEILKTMSCKEYMESKWQGLINRGLVDESDSKPRNLKTPFDLTNNGARLQYNKEISEYLISTLLGKGDNGDITRLIKERRESLVYKAVNRLPLGVRCDLFSIFRADFEIFGYSTDGYDLDACGEGV